MCTSIYHIITGVVEDSPQARPTSICVQLERLGRVGIGQNECCGAQTLEFIECLLVPVIPGDGCPHFTCVFAGCQFVQGSGYLQELGDTLLIVPCESKKAPDLDDGGGGEPLLIAIIFSSPVGIPWTETKWPRCVIFLQNSYHLEGLSFSLACSNFWNMASSLMR